MLKLFSCRILYKIFINEKKISTFILYTQRFFLLCFPHHTLHIIQRSWNLRPNVCYVSHCSNKIAALPNGNSIPVLTIMHC